MTTTRNPDVPFRVGIGLKGAGYAAAPKNKQHQANSIFTPGYWVTWPPQRNVPGQIS